MNLFLTPEEIQIEIPAVIPPQFKEEETPPILYPQINFKQGDEEYPYMGPPGGPASPFFRSP